MKNLMNLLIKNTVAFILSYITYNAVYMVIALLIINRHPERTILYNYWLLISQSFLVMILPIILLIFVFNLIVGLTKNRVDAQPVVKRTIWLTLIGGVLGFVGYALVHLLSTNNVWIIDLPTLLLLAGIFFGFFYSLLSPRLIKVS